MSRKQKSGGMLWRWLRAVQEAVRVDDSLTTARKSATMNVALQRALHADPDGRNCFPAQSTVAAGAFTKRVVVIGVDAWLIEHGLLALTGRTGLGGTKAYRLTIPPDGFENSDNEQSKMYPSGYNFDVEDVPQKEQLRAQKMYPSGNNFDVEDVPEDVPEVVPVGVHNLLPPTDKEEVEVSVDERAGARTPPDIAACRRWLADFCIDKPSPYRELGTTRHEPLLSEVERIRRDWPPNIAAAEVTDLPAKPKSAAGLIARRLADLADSPSADAYTSATDDTDDILDQLVDDLGCVGTTGRVDWDGFDSQLGWQYPEAFRRIVTDALERLGVDDDITSEFIAEYLEVEGDIATDDDETECLNFLRSGLHRIVGGKLRRLHDELPSLAAQALRKAR